MKYYIFTKYKHKNINIFFVADWFYEFLENYFSFLDIFCALIFLFLKLNPKNKNDKYIKMLLNNIISIFEKSIVIF